MGITTALNTTVGSYQSSNFKMFSKLLVAAAVAVCVSAEAEADAGVFVAPALYNAYPNWPGVSTPYSQSTCFGCRPYVYGKRSADAEPEADADALYGYYGYRPYGYGYGYRAYGYGYPYRYGYYGKRSADAEPEADAFYGYAYAPYAYAPYRYGYGLGVAAHPGAATSFVARSPQGLGKRSADAGIYGYADLDTTESQSPPPPMDMDLLDTASPRDTPELPPPSSPSPDCTELSTNPNLF